MKIYAYTADNKIFDDDVANKFKTIGDFNDFFRSNRAYYMLNCNIKLENGMNIESHDDGEVSIRFVRNSSDRLIIDNIFKKYKLDERLLGILKSKPGHYITIDRYNKVTGDYKNFDDYIKNGLE